MTGVGVVLMSDTDTCPILGHTL